MYTLGDTDGAPVLQFSVEVTKRDPPTGWATVPSFVSGPPHRPLSKEAFYSKLGQTPDALLPKVEQTVTITFREEAKGKGGADVLAPGAAAASDSDSEGSVDIDGDDGGDALKGLTSTAARGQGEGPGEMVVAGGAADGGAKKGPTTLVDVFLVCAAIGGGGAKKMACLPEHRHMKLIPWGGVSRCRREGEQWPTFERCNKCFLSRVVKVFAAASSAADDDGTPHNWLFVFVRLRRRLKLTRQCCLKRRVMT